MLESQSKPPRNHDDSAPTAHDTHLSHPGT